MGPSEKNSTTKEFQVPNQIEPAETLGHFIPSSVMVHGRKDLSSCWTPCFWHNNVRDGSLAVAVYTFFMSLAVVTYCVYIMTGGDTSQLWLPFFETDLKDTLQGAGGFTVFYFALLSLLSILLLIGVRTNIRGLFLPWIAAMYVVVLFQAMFGLWLIFGYYIYLEVVFAALCDWVWMGLHIYCIEVVRSHLTGVKRIQSPDIEYLNTF